MHCCRLPERCGCAGGLVSARGPVGEGPDPELRPRSFTLRGVGSPTMREVGCSNNTPHERSLRWHVDIASTSRSNRCAGSRRSRNARSATSQRSRIDAGGQACARASRAAEPPPPQAVQREGGDKGRPDITPSCCPSSASRALLATVSEPHDPSLDGSPRSSRTISLGSPISTCAAPFSAQHRDGRPTQTLPRWRAQNKRKRCG